MAKINIKLNALDRAVLRLILLKGNAGLFQTSPPTVVGGGTAINELESLGDLYVEINQQISLLISNTIGFMKNVRTSYSHTDEMLARMFEKQ